MIAPTGTQSIDRAAQLLCLVIDGDDARTVGELASEAGLPKSTVSRLVGSLERSGLVKRESARGGLRPGPVLVRFAQRGGLGTSLVELAEPAMRLLADLSGETVNVAIPDLNGVDCLAQIDSQHFLGTGNWVGRRVPVHASTFGKVFLAFGALRLGDEPLARLAPRTIVDRRRLEAELARVRAQGFATAVDELEPGLAAVAAPVVGARGEVVASLAISGPALRMPVERLEALGRLCQEQAAAVSTRLGHTTVAEGAA
jgi:DNA-binding IclR family transcriptional regulator